MEETTPTNEPKRSSLRRNILILIGLGLLATLAIRYYFSISFYDCDGHGCKRVLVEEVLEWKDIYSIKVIRKTATIHQEVKVNNTKKGKRVLDNPPEEFPNLKEMFNTEMSNIEDFLRTGAQPDENSLRHFVEEVEKVRRCPVCYCKKTDFDGKTVTEVSSMVIRRTDFNSITYEIVVEYKGRHQIFEGECIKE